MGRSEPPSYREVARILAGGLQSRNVKLVDRSATYAHNDPSAAAPKVNAFLKRLIPFLNSISAGNKVREARR